MTTSTDPHIANGPTEFGLLDRLAALFRTYALPADARVLPRPFARDDRHGFLAALPREWVGDDAAASEVVLFEDGLPLGPAHAAHDDIRTLGKGRYSHWGATLYFSSSDGTDPNRNGRTYAVRPPAGWIGELPRAAVTVAPGPDPGPGAASVRWETCEVVDPRPRAGLAFSASVPSRWVGDETDLSTLVLFEDDRPLPLPHALHDEIATLGAGRYSHWAGALIFSSSDGSDPRRNGRRYVATQAEALRIGDGPAHRLEPAGGRCFVIAGLPQRWVGDDAGSSRLQLLEDGRSLGPAHALHDEIRELGAGRYSHWAGSLLFSTSDGSDPRGNGRVYTLLLAD